MRCGGQQKQTVRAARKQPSQSGAAGDASRTPFSNIMRFINDNNIPEGMAQIAAVFGVLFQGVD